MARRRAAIPKPEQLQALYAARQAAKNSASQPTSEQLEALYEARRAAKNSAKPGHKEESLPPGVMRRYKVLGNRVCHGKKKGDCVDLWDTGATRALVQAGHLIECPEEKDQAVESADNVREADNGQADPS